MVNDRGHRADGLILGASCLLALIVAAAIFGPFLSPYAYNQITPNQFAPPSWQHWLGTDLHGRDVLTRVLYGARISLLVGLIGSLVSLVVGTSYGLISGYVGGRLDDLMMRLVDILYSLPRLIIVILLIGVFDRQVKGFLEGLGWGALVPHSRLIVLFFGLGLVEWLTMARIVRGQVLSLKEQTFVQASRAMGQRPIRIILLHLLPNLRGIIIVYLTLTIPAVILEESFLSFLGLGVQAPQSSWGTLLSDGAAMINPVRIAWWLLVGPALFMASTLLALNFIGDALRDKFDPRSQNR